MTPTLRLHAALDGYVLAFVSPGNHETIARFATLPAAARALRAAKAAASNLPGLPMADGDQLGSDAE